MSHWGTAHQAFYRVLQHLTSPFQLQPGLVRSRDSGGTWPVASLCDWTVCRRIGGPTFRDPVAGDVSADNPGCLQPRSLNPCLLQALSPLKPGRVHYHHIINSAITSGIRRRKLQLCSARRKPHPTTAWDYPYLLTLSYTRALYASGHPQTCDIRDTLPVEDDLSGVFPSAIVTGDSTAFLPVTSARRAQRYHTPPHQNSSRYHICRN